MNQILFLITARLKSRRFPKKVLKPLGKQSVFEQVLDRAKAVKGPKEVISCTSTDPQDDPLEELSRKKGVQCYRGEADDVLKRLLGALRRWDGEAFLGMTADNPLFSIQHASMLIEAARGRAADYFVIEGLPLGTAPYLVSRSAFERIDKYKEEQDTEFWPEYLRDEEVFKRVTLKADARYRLEARLTLDYQEDYGLFRTIYEKFGDDRPPDLLQVIGFLRDNPELLQLNQHIKRSWLNQETRRRIAGWIRVHRRELAGNV